MCESAEAAFNALEAAAWEEKPTSYDSFFAPITSRLVGPILDAAAVGSGTRVLDVATGPGYVAAAAAGRGASAVGVDVAAAMVSLARRRYPGLDFRQADAESLPFPADSFDAVTANLALMHFGRPEQAVAEFARVLAPGGRLALTAWDFPDRARLVGVFIDAVAAVNAALPPGVPAGPSFFRFSPDGECSRLLGSAGLTRVAVRTLQFEHSVSSGDDFWDGMLAATVRTSALIVGQPEDVQKRIRAAFDQLVARYAREGGLAIPVSVKLATAKKPELAATQPHL